jgi:predicted nucleic acid-binding protein
MAASVLVDASFLVALLSRDDAHHAWAAALSLRLPPTWKTCEAALSEAFHLLGMRGGSALAALPHRRAMTVHFHLSEDVQGVLRLMQKYSNVPMSFAAACMVRMTEMVADPVLLTTDADFRIYRRHGRRAIPCEMPG